MGDRDLSEQCQCEGDCRKESHVEKAIRSPVLGYFAARRKQRQKPGVNPPVHHCQRHRNRKHSDAAEATVSAECGLGGASNDVAIHDKRQHVCDRIDRGNPRQPVAGDRALRGEHEEQQSARRVSHDLRTKLLHSAKGGCKSTVQTGR